MSYTAQIFILKISPALAYVIKIKYLSGTNQYWATQSRLKYIRQHPSIYQDNGNIMKFKRMFFQNYMKMIWGVDIIWVQMTKYPTIDHRTQLIYKLNIEKSVLAQILKLLINWHIHYFVNNYMKIKDTLVLHFLC